MARFVSSLHPRGKDGKFVKKGGGSSSPARKKSSGPKTRQKVARAGERTVNRARKTKNNLKGPVGKVLAAKAVYDDITDVASHGAKAYAYGATGNYVKSALHGAKAGTAGARLGSRAAGAIVRNAGQGKAFSQAKKRKFYAAQAKFDDRVQTIDNAATIGLVLTGGALRKKSPAGTNGVKGIGSGSKGLKPARRNRQGVYQITKVKKVTAGARVRR